MKKLAKLFLALFIVASMIPSTHVFAEESYNTNDNERKARYFSYGMYMSFRDDGEVEIKESIADLEYEEIRSIVRSEIVDKLTPDEGETVIWDPAFVLELVPEEFPDLYEQLYAALLNQGYNPQEGIVAEVNFESNSNSRASSFTVTKPHVYNAPIHGTVLVSSNTISWTNTSSGFNITSATGSVTGGWPMLDKTISKRNNNTANAYAYYSYTTVESAYTYSANSQFQLIPSTNGTVTLTILTEDITAYGIGFKLTEWL